MIPEGSVRTELAHRFHVSPSDYLSLLERLGSECVGALLFESGDSPRHSFVPSYITLSKAQLQETALRPIYGAASSMQASRLSLAGAQSKTGLFLSKNENPQIASDRAWKLPEGSAPSTHIIKIAENRFSTLAANEYICMMLARACKIETADTILMPHMERTIVSRRFDRFWPKDVRLIGGEEAPYRLHQEDFCQALGWPSYLKYELPGTASYAVVAGNLINRISSDIIADKLAFTRQTIFNYFIGNCDNHFKNYSFLYSPLWNAKRLAPAYDIVCTTILGFDRKMGFEIGFHQIIDEITPDDWRQFADDIGLPTERVLSIYKEVIDSIRAQAFSLEESLPPTARDTLRDIMGDAEPRLSR